MVRMTVELKTTTSKQQNDLNYMVPDKLCYMSELDELQNNIQKLLNQYNRLQKRRNWIHRARTSRKR